MIARVGIRLALSGFAHDQQRVTLGVLAVAAALTALSGHVAPVGSMVHAIELLGRADLIRDGPAVLWGLVPQAVQLNVAKQRRWPMPLFALLAPAIGGFPVQQVVG